LGYNHFTTFYNPIDVLFPLGGGLTEGFEDTPLTTGKFSENDDRWD
jgi:hypothetical protein